MIHAIWYDTGRDPVRQPNPDYPNGIDIDVSKGAKSCRTELPHPTPRCGYFYVVCTICHYGCAITTAGRPDDPRSITIPCKEPTNAQQRHSRKRATGRKPL